MIILGASGAVRVLATVVFFAAVVVSVLFVLLEDGRK